MIKDARRVCELAEKQGVRICLEYHGGSLTDSLESAQSLLESLPLSNLDSLWQPPNGQPDDHCEKTLLSILPRVSNLHVFHWGQTGWKERYALSEGRERWARFFALANTDPQPRFALLEFVKGDSLEQFREDARTLNGLLQE